MHHIWILHWCSSASPFLLPSPFLFPRLQCGPRPDWSIYIWYVKWIANILHNQRNSESAQRLFSAGLNATSCPHIYTSSNLTQLWEARSDPFRMGLKILLPPAAFTTGISPSQLLKMRPRPTFWSDIWSPSSDFAVHTLQSDSDIYCCDSFTEVIARYMEWGVHMSKTDRFLRQDDNFAWCAVRGHGVSDKVIADIFSRNKAFFALPLEEKNKIASKHDKNFRGFTPMQVWLSYYTWCNAAMPHSHCNW